MKKLILLLNELETKFQFKDIKDLSVSQSAVSWHIDHTIKVLLVVIDAMKNVDSSKHKKKFNFIKHIIFTIGSIPRGKAKAPKSVQTFDEITLDSLKNQLEQARFHVSLWNHLSVRSNFNHPYFGVLNLKESEKFLIIHTQHHLKIINEIVKKNTTN